MKMLRSDIVRNSVLISKQNPIRDLVWNSVSDSVSDSVWDSVQNPVRNLVWDSVWLSFCGLVRRSILKEITNENA